MKHILLLFLFMPLFVYSQKSNGGLITCNLQVSLKQDTTTFTGTLVNSFTTDWYVGLEMQPDRNAQDSWQLGSWMAIPNPSPQTTELPFFMHVANQTRSNLFQGVLQVRDKVCVYLFQK